MTQNIGDSTTLFEGRLRGGGKQCESAIDHVAVNGFCRNDREPWTSQDQRFWLEDWLLQPEARILLVSNRLNSNSSMEDLLREGESLLRVVERYRSNTDVPLIFHCFGLGGIIFLKALKISESRNVRRKLALTTAGVVFFGTPVVPQKLVALKKTLQDCFTVELQLGRQQERIVEDHVAEEIQELFKLPEICNFDILSFFEKHESTWNRQRAWGINQKRKILVPKTLAYLNGSNCLGLERDHYSIAKLDWSSFSIISQHIKNIVDRYDRLIRPTLGLAENSENQLTSTTQTSNVPPTIEDFQAPELSGSSRTTFLPSTHELPSVVQTSENRALNLPFHKIDLPENSSFVGRDDVLADLDRELAQGLGTQTMNRAFAIYGTAGVGKTQTALKFAYNHKAAFPSILWASSETRYKLLQSLSEYSVLLGLVAKPSDPAGDAEILMQWYRTTATPWLVIFDNAVDISLILDYWPKSKSGAILITTQKPIFAGPDLCRRGRELLQLDEASAITLLQSSLLQPSTNTEDARTIVQRVGCLPVAIRTCIGQINEADCTLDDYNKEWNDARSIISQSDVKYVESLNARYDKGLRDLWAKSFRNLNDDARALINVFSLMDDEHIPEELLKNESLYQELPFLRHRVRAIRDLAESSLIGKETQSQSQASKRFHIHRMTRAFAQMQMDPESCQAAFDSAALLLNATVVSNSRDPNFARNKSYFQHVQALYDYYESTVNGESDQSNRILVASIAFIQLLRKTTWWCYRVNFFGPGLRFIETINAIHNQPKIRPIVPGGAECLEVEMVWNHYQHGSIQTELGNFQESYNCFRSALDCREVAAAKGYIGLPRLYAIYGGLGNSYNGLGLQAESEEYYKRSLKLKPDSEDFSNYEINICGSLWAQGQPRLAEASKRLEDFIRRRTQMYGEEDTVNYLSGHAFYMLGNVRISQAQDPMITPEQKQQWLDDAYNFHAKSWKSWKVTHGEEHHYTADACLRYAWHLTQRGNNEAAISLLERALVIYQTPSNRDYRKAEIARTNFKLSLVFAKEGNIDMAEKHKAEAEKIRADILKEKFRPAVGLESYDSLVSLWQL